MDEIMVNNECYHNTTAHEIKIKKKKNGESCAALSHGGVFHRGNCTYIWNIF